MSIVKGISNELSQIKAYVGGYDYDPTADAETLAKFKRVDRVKYVDVVFIIIRDMYCLLKLYAALKQADPLF